MKAVKLNVKAKKLKLFSKIFLNFFLLVLLIVVAISMTTYFESSSLLEDGVNDQLNILVQEKANMLQEIIKNAQTSSNLIASNTHIQEYFLTIRNAEGIIHDQDISQYLSQIFENGDGLYENVFIGSMKDQIVIDGLGGKSVGTDTKPYDFIQGAKKGTATIGKVITSPVTGRPVIGIASPVKSAGQTIGISAAPVEFSVLSKPVTQSKIGASGFTFITNKQGLVLAHPKNDLVMKLDLSKQTGSLGKLGKRMTLEAQGIGTYSDEGQEHIIAFQQIPNSDFIVASVVDAEEVYAPIKSLLLKSVILGIIALVLTLAAAASLAGNITRPIKKLAAAVQRVANGDLTFQLDIKRRDELGDLAGDLLSMQSGIKNMIEHISSTSRYVADTSQSLSTSTLEATKSIKQVAEAIEQIAAGSEEQSKSASDTLQTTQQVILAIDQIAAGAQNQSENAVTTSTLVDNMGSQIQTMAEGMLTVKELSEQNGEVATEGGKVVQMTVKGMLSVKDATADTAVKINELGEQSQKIGEIIEVIDDIAEQTNLLALNAAIEAARAGEHGKGFAVVADEVRKLAERSGKATKEIANLITDMQRGTRLAVESMRVGSKEVEDGVNLAQEAGKSLNKIVEGVEEAGIKVKEIMELIKDVLHSSSEVSSAVNNVAAITEENTAATQEMSASSEQVSISMQNVAAISEENASSSEEVSESAEKLAGSIEEISASSNQLAEMAEELQQMVGKFKV